MKLLLAAIGASVVLPFAVIQDDAANCMGTEWRWQFVQGTPVPVVINSTGEPFAGARTSLVNSMGIWNGVGTSAFSWSDAGNSSAVGFVFNGSNHVSWNDPNADLGGGILAAAVPFAPGDTFDWNGNTWREVAEMDVVFNDGINFVDNATAGNPALCNPAVDNDFSVEATMIHELGHGLGLQHPDDCDPNYTQGYPGAVMFSTIQNCDGTKGVLQADDMNGVTYLYDSSAPSVYPSFDVDTDLGYAPLDVAFTDTSLGATQWAWDFGDGNTSTTQSPTHTFAAQGAFAVALTIEGSVPAPTRVISVFDPPLVDFSAPQTTGEAPFTIQFQNDSSGDIISYLWDFGDGNSSTEASPSHRYTRGGTYTVQLTAEGQAGPIVNTKADFITIENGESDNPFTQFMNDMGCECAVSRPMGRAPQASAALLALFAALVIVRRRRR